MTPNNENSRAQRIFNFCSDAVPSSFTQTFDMDFFLKILSDELDRTQNETRRAELLQMMSVHDNNLNEVEAARNEPARLQAETGRRHAETGRLQAETGRLQAETGRLQAEPGRLQAETGRLQAETATGSTHHHAEAAHALPVVQANCNERTNKRQRVDDGNPGKKTTNSFCTNDPFSSFFFTTRRWMNWFFYSDASASLSSERNSIRSTRSEDEFRRELAPFLTYHYRLLSGRGNRGELVIDSTNFVQLEESAVLSFDRFVELCEIDNETAASIRGAEANMFNIHSLSAIVQKSEDDLQNHINTRLGIVQGIDTHARTQFDVPLFTLPTGSGNEIHIAHSHSEEPDCVATRFRGCFEVKSQSTKVCTSIKPAAVINHQF
jgi:hypothetical protein